MRGLAANIIDLKVGEVITIAMQPNNTGAWFGAEVGPIDNIIAEQFGLTNTKGVIVNQVFTDSPAEKAGVKRGDVILKINGRKAADIGRFQKLTSLLNPGDVMRMSLMRNNQEVKLIVGLESKQGRTITKQPANTRVAVVPPEEVEWAGMEVTPITPQLALRYGIRKGGSGVVVLEVEGMAAAAGIMNGDVIRGLNKQNIKNMTDFVNTAPNINILDGVLFDISRRGDPLYITM
jgi:serine protease Do